MNRLNKITPLCAALLLATGAAQAGAPASAAPAALTTYSLVKPPPNAHDMGIAIYRDGTRETIKLSRANGWHSQQWFDFAAHKQWVNDSNAPGQCSVITYTSDGPPPLLDPIPGGGAMLSEIPANAPSPGKETLGGIETRVVVFPDGQGKIWIDDAHHMVIKMVAMMDGHPPLQTVVDFTGIRFDKPDPALLVPPTGCKQTQGSSNANGGHAEVPLGSS